MRLLLNNVKNDCKVIHRIVSYVVRSTRSRSVLHIKMALSLRNHEREKKNGTSCHKIWFTELFGIHLLKSFDWQSILDSDFILCLPLCRMDKKSTYAFSAWHQTFSLSDVLLFLFVSLVQWIKILHTLNYENKPQIKEWKIINQQHQHNNTWWTTSMEDNRIKEVKCTVLE